ncbi:hypothetical protein DRJ22_05960 [Candidatus Woesearchaeota archaeon]|nr:MAG: hypothetical protein DRJ22_05960 [Candidatus Woesearchaeota archaeon]
MMSETGLIRIVLAIIVGVLFGIVYTMRILVLMERRIARIEVHIERLVAKVLKEEETILDVLGEKKKAVKSVKKSKKSRKKRR